jgi:hypothetical protein
LFGHVSGAAFGVSGGADESTDFRSDDHEAGSLEVFRRAGNADFLQAGFLVCFDLSEEIRAFCSPDVERFLCRFGLLFCDSEINIQRYEVRKKCVTHYSNIIDP